MLLVPFQIPFSGSAPPFVVTLCKMITNHHSVLKLLRSRLHNLAVVHTWCCEPPHPLNVLKSNRKSNNIARCLVAYMSLGTLDEGIHSLFVLNRPLIIVCGCMVMGCRFWAHISIAIMSPVRGECKVKLISGTSCLTLWWVRIPPVVISCRVLSHSSLELLYLFFLKDNGEQDIWPLTAGRQVWTVPVSLDKLHYY